METGLSSLPHRHAEVSSCDRVGLRSLPRLSSPAEMDLGMIIEAIQSVFGVAERRREDQRGVRVRRSDMSDSVYPRATATIGRRRHELAPEIHEAFQAFSKTVFAAGALPEKTKQLIAVAAAHVTQCPYCIAGHTQLARRKGASDEEIMEAIWVAAEIPLAVPMRTRLSHSPPWPTGKRAAPSKHRNLSVPQTRDCDAKKYHAADDCWDQIEQALPVTCCDSRSGSLWRGRTRPGWCHSKLKRPSPRSAVVGFSSRCKSVPDVPRSVRSQVPG